MINKNLKRLNEMQKIIVYGSEYGTTKRYADELSNKTGVKAFSYTEVQNLTTYDKILYLGGLYAGGILGLAKTIKKFPINSTQTFIIVTVGLADPNNQTNTDSIKRAIANQIPIEIYRNAQIFHLRGGVDYQKLHYKHKVMMKLLYNKVKNLPQEQQNAETKALIDSYNQKVDFIDLDSLSEIIAVF